MVNVIYPTESQAKFDAVKQTAEILGQLYEKAGFTTKKVSLSVPSNVAFVSVLNFPPMPEKEMQKSVEYQAKKYIPLPISEVNIGWQILEETLLKSPHKDAIPEIKVLLTAVPRNVINNYLRVMELVGFEVAALEIESLSLIRSLVDAEAKDGILIIDIGAKSTILSYVHQGHLMATRHLTIGGDSITSSIANSMGISFERAEQMKRAVLAPNVVSPAAQISRNVVELIRSEVQQFMRMTENESNGIARIILTGGGSKMPGLAEKFSALGPKVEFGNPLAKLNFPPELENKLVMLAPQLSVACGLALRQE